MAETCPKCSAEAAVAQTGEGPYGVCIHCDVCWEIETRADPCAVRCDNCAFRPGSPEQADRDRWLTIQFAVESGEPFFCHKRLPFRLIRGDGGELTNSSFEGPSWGDVHDPAYKGVMPSICAGWSAARAALVAKEKARA